MDGFHFIQSTTCVIFLFQSWVLDTGGKYALAFLGTLLLGICLEKLIQQRRKTMASMEAGRKRLAVSATFYGVQLTIGYFLMLIIMIYAGALFIATILGLVFGHVLFNAKDAMRPIQTTPSKVLVPTDSPPPSETGTENQQQCGDRAECGCKAAGTKEIGCDCDRCPSDEEVVESGCCGSKAKAEATAETTLREPQIPEGGTPCCQYSSCD